MAERAHGEMSLSARKCLLIWDAANMDASLGQLLGRKPAADDRPDMAALGRWLVEQAGEAEVEACVFVTVPKDVSSGMEGWVQYLRSVGFRVFAKPKLEGGQDVDVDMLKHLEKRQKEGDLEQVFIGSHDAEAFREAVTSLVAAGVRVTVLGFREFLGGYGDVGADFVDLEQIPSLFRVKLPRLNLRSLEEARWFEPTGRLGGL